MSEIPPPATTTPPVLDATELVTTLNVTVPFVEPDAPSVMAIHETLDTAVHAAVAVTLIVFPLAAALDRLVLVGLMERVVVDHRAVGRFAQVLGTVGQPVAPARRKTVALLHPSHGFAPALGALPLK